MRCFAARMIDKRNLPFHFLPVNQARMRLNPKIPARKLQLRRSEEFRRSLARIACEARASATARGNPKGGAALFGQSLPTFCWSESRGPRAAREVPRRGKRVEGKNQKFNRRKGINKVSPRKAPGQQTPKRTLSASREKSHFVEAWREENKKFPPSPFDKFVHAGVVCLETSRGCVSC